MYQWQFAIWCWLFLSSYFWCKPSHWHLKSISHISIRTTSAQFSYICNNKTKTNWRSTEHVSHLSLSVDLITEQRTIDDRRHMTHDDGRNSIQYCTWRKWRKKTSQNILFIKRLRGNTDRQNYIWIRLNCALYVLSFYVHYMRIVH